MDTIYFDLDGTLTDPKPGITRSIQYALQRLDHPTIPTEDELTWCIGPPLRTSFVRLLGDHTADRAVALYRERFSDIGLYENRVYDGIGEVLTTLRASGHRLFVATSKAHVFADRIIDHFGLRDHFEYVFGAELDGTRADKSHLLEYALKQAAVGGQPSMEVRLPNPQLCSVGSDRPPAARAVLASVLAPASPYSAASGSAPAPQESMTRTTKRPGISTSTAVPERAR